MLKTYNLKDTTQLVFSYKKTYPKYTKLILYNRPYVKTIEGFEPHEQKKATASHKKSQDPIQEEDNKHLSLSRTKRKITDLTICNDFDAFATFTFKHNREDINYCKQTMSNWLQSQQKKYGKFNYIIVPEYHKNKKAIHFHALLKNYQGKLTPTKHKIKGRKVYNIKSYRSGFTTLVKIDNIEKVSSYIRKYITKDMPKMESKKRYWRSTGLIQPIVEINTPEEISDYELLYKNSVYRIYKKNVV